MDEENSYLYKAVFEVMRHCSTYLSSWTSPKPIKAILDFFFLNLDRLQPDDKMWKTASQSVSWSIDSVSEYAANILRSAVMLCRAVNRYRRTMGRKPIDFFKEVDK